MLNAGMPRTGESYGIQVPTSRKLAPDWVQPAQNHMHAQVHPAQPVPTSSEGPDDGH